MSHLYHPKLGETAVNKTDSNPHAQRACIFWNINIRYLVMVGCLIIAMKKKKVKEAEHVWAFVAWLTDEKAVPANLWERSYRDGKARAEICLCEFTSSLDWLIFFFFFLVLGLKPRTPCTPGKRSVTELHTRAFELGVTHCNHEFLGLSKYGSTSWFTKKCWNGQNLSGYIPLAWLFLHKQITVTAEQDLPSFGKDTLSVICSQV